MEITAHTILLILAVVVFAVETFRSRDFVAAGLALLALSFLV